MDTALKIFLNRWFSVVFCMGVIALTCSFLASEIFHIKPCFLCKLQRIPFALLVANAGIGLVGPYKEGFFRITTGCLVLGVLLGVIHSLIQLGIVPDFCISQRGFETKEEFLQILQTSKCSNNTWSILGIPTSLLNVMLHGSVLGLSIRLKSRKKRMRGAL